MVVAAMDEPDPTGERDPRPVVRLARPALPGAAIVFIAAVLALILFMVLNSRRRSATPYLGARAATAAPAFAPPPPLAIPPEPAFAPPAPPVPQAVPAPLVPIIVEQPRSRPMIGVPATTPTPAPPLIPDASLNAMPAQVMPRRNEAALVFDGGPIEGNSLQPPSTGGASGATPGASAEDSPARTTIIRNRSTLMPVGTMIPAVLETPIDSARPGLVRAVVSQDIRGFDGKRVLVSRGSRLIGEYQSDVRSGQSRVLVTWTRLIRPDGVAIRIGSPAADALGGAGIPGQVNNFFFRRFAGAVLQSALAVGVNLASRPGNGSVIIGLPANSASSVGQELLPANDLRPKIKVKQGVVVNVFVARDLDFSGTPLLLPDNVR